jgi:hypothetical protein
VDNPYATLLQISSDYAAEDLAKYNWITERHLQVIWLEQKYFANLVTHEGLAVQVISAGIWNSDAGPDFLKAHVIIGNKEYKGDIEIHLDPRSWYTHGHHTDERYSQVILHVSLWTPKRDHTVYNHFNEPISNIYLENSLTLPLNRLVSLIDLDLYP